MLEFLDEISGEAELVGAEKMFTAYLNALILEVNIAANTSKAEGFGEIAANLQKVIEYVKVGCANFKGQKPHLGWSFPAFNLSK